MNSSDQNSDTRKRKFSIEEESNKTLDLSLSITPPPPPLQPMENLVFRPPLNIPSFDIVRSEIASNGGVGVFQTQSLPACGNFRPEIGQNGSLSGGDRNLGMNLRNLPPLSPALQPLHSVENTYSPPPVTSQPVFRPEIITSIGGGVRPNESPVVCTRRNFKRKRSEKKSATVSFPPPFPWAKNTRATVYSLKELRAQNITVISGDVECKRCNRSYVIELNLYEKYIQIYQFIVKNIDIMHKRAPENWMSPVLPRCKFCLSENSMKPIISEEKDATNWLFLVLGQMLGCFTLEHLRYFCEHNNIHRTGSKDRLLYITYLELCKQLDPEEILFCEY